MNKKISVLISFLFVVFSLLAQTPKTYSSTNSKAIKLYEDALNYYTLHDIEKTLKTLDKAIEKDPNFIEPYLVKSGIFLEKKEPKKSIELYNKTFEINPDFAPNSFLFVAEIELSLGLYEDAKMHTEKFLKYPNGEENYKKVAEKFILNCEFAIYALSHPVPFEPKSMGEGINSQENEYFPSITADGKTFLFTREIKDINGLTNTGYQEDFFVSKRNNENWFPAQNFGSPINTPNNEGAPSISADGQILIFAACNRPEGKGSCDIYFARKIGIKWSPPMNSGPPINTKNWETQPSFSSDGKTLYFVRGIVTREGVKSQDIYFSELSKDGIWQTPVTLGNKINTPYREVSVFIHPDNQTLYFSSDGHPGMGGLDIFMSKRQPNSEWGEPINLGYPINTSNDENSLLVSPDGTTAYFASNREGGKGGLDLYQFELYKEARPEKITYVNGKVYDSKTKKPLSASFELIDLETAKTVVESESNMGNGEFLICLPANKNYAFNVSRKGYLFYSENFSLKNSSADFTKPYMLDIPLQPIDTGSTVELKNIFFETGKYDLKEESKAELQKLVSFLTTNPIIKIEISGHTDNVGDKKLNITLSQNRAKSVYDYLIKNSITAERLLYKGYGDAKPKVANDTEENKARNRRTEFKVIAK